MTKNENRILIAFAILSVINFSTNVWQDILHNWLENRVEQLERMK